MEILTMILSYLPYIIVLLTLIGGAIAFFKNERKTAREWLLFAVTEIEKIFGGGTGRLKLRACFDQFVKAYPVFSKFIKFETFSKWVDEALIEMRRLLDTNDRIKEYVVCDEKGDE